MPPSFNHTSPCSVLFDDVLREIFIACCAHGPQNISKPFFVEPWLPSIRDFPQLSVSRVCRSWRHIALSTPQLWNNIIIKEFTKANLRIAREYLSRARNVPISIELNHPQSNFVDYSNLTDFLSLYRLRSLTVQRNIAAFYLVLPNLSQRSVADLETLMIFNYRNPKKGSIDLNDIRYPKLTVFHIGGLHKLSVFSSSLCIFEGSRLLMTVTEGWEFLSRCPSLEEASFCLPTTFPGDDRTSPSVPLTLIHLQHLRELDLNSDSVMGEFPFSTFIEALALPVIEKLYGPTSCQMSWSLPAFQSLASRSNYFPYLSHILLENPTSVVDTGALFASMPSLTSMKLFWINPNENVTFDHHVLDGLANGSLGPRLQFLLVGFISNEGEFLHMVESRMKNAETSGDIVPAPFARVSYFASDDPSSTRLHDMQQRGISIFKSCRKSSVLDND